MQASVAVASWVPSGTPLEAAIHHPHRQPYRGCLVLVRIKTAPSARTAHCLSAVKSPVKPVKSFIALAIVLVLYGCLGKIRPIEGGPHVGPPHVRAVPVLARINGGHGTELPNVANGHCFILSLHRTYRAECPKGNMPYAIIVKIFWGPSGPRGHHPNFATHMGPMPRFRLSALVSIRPQQEQVPVRWP